MGFFSRNANPQQFARVTTGSTQYLEHQALEPRTVEDWGHTAGCDYCDPNHMSNYRNPPEYAEHPSVIGPRRS